MSKRYPNFNFEEKKQLIASVRYSSGLSHMTSPGIVELTQPEKFDMKHILDKANTAALTTIEFFSYLQYSPERAKKEPMKKIEFIGVSAQQINHNILKARDKFIEHEKNLSLKLNK